MAFSSARTQRNSRRPLLLTFPVGGSYADDICFEQFIIPGAGHDVNVHFESHRWFAVATEWTQRMVTGDGPCRT